ncbi:hypothetical protein FRB99_004184, partial [Tulasnella sp. 403]
DPPSSSSPPRKGQPNNSPHSKGPPAKKPRTTDPESDDQSYKQPSSDTELEIGSDDVVHEASIASLQESLRSIVVGSGSNLDATRTGISVLRNNKIIKALSEAEVQELNDAIKVVASTINRAKQHAGG